MCQNLLFRLKKRKKKFQTENVLSNSTLHAPQVATLGILGYVIHPIREAFYPG
jgi:hypothetical protein